MSSSPTLLPPPPPPPIAPSLSAIQGGLGGLKPATERELAPRAAGPASLFDEIKARAKQVTKAAKLDVEEDLLRQLDDIGIGRKEATDLLTAPTSKRLLGLGWTAIDIAIMKNMERAELARDRVKRYDWIDEQTRKARINLLGAAWRKSATSETQCECFVNMNLKAKLGVGMFKTKEECERWLVTNQAASITDTFLNEYVEEITARRLDNARRRLKLEKEQLAGLQQTVNDPAKLQGLIDVRLEDMRYTAFKQELAKTPGTREDRWMEQNKLADFRRDFGQAQEKDIRFRLESLKQRVYTTEQQVAQLKEEQSSATANIRKFLKRALKAFNGDQPRYDKWLRTEMRIIKDEYSEEGVMRGLRERGLLRQLSDSLHAATKKNIKVPLSETHMEDALRGSIDGKYRENLEKLNERVAALEQDRQAGRREVGELEREEVALKQELEELRRDYRNEMAKLEAEMAGKTSAEAILHIMQGKSEVVGPGQDLDALAAALASNPAFICRVRRELKQ